MAEDSPVIHARTWKSAQLATQSTYFPRMVQAAAAYHGKPYSQHLVDKVASNQGIVDGITLRVGQTVDDALLALMTASATSGQQVDTAILNAVQAYTPPPPGGGSPAAA